MKVINQCDNSIYLNDIDLIVPFNAQGKPFEIDEKLVKRSVVLATCLASGMLADEKQEGAMPGAYTRRQQMLSREDQYRNPGPKPVPTRKKKKIAPRDEVCAFWTGPAYDYGGYANMNRRFMFGLEDRGDIIKYIPMDSLRDADAELLTRIDGLSKNQIPDYAPMVYGQTAPLIYDWSKYKALFTMMETRALHPHYVERCNSADELIVPSHWCEEMFKESGVTKPITVAPLGVDTELFTPDAKPLGFSKGLKDFVFISVFGWSMRKGYDVLLRAYFEEFTAKDDVSLVIMSRYFGSTDEVKKQKIRDDIAQVTATVKNPSRPHLSLFGDTLSEHLMPRLYASADCYVLISRGEGFGLPYCEAAACGLPVIGSRYSGQTDFLDDENSYLVDVDGFREADQSLSWITYFYEGAEFPIFGDVAVEQTRAHMRDAFENRDKAQKKADLLRERIVTEYDWNIGIGKMHDKLKELNDKEKQK
jgi:glycosyltransferase involved in cell wall biosynthesis